MSLPGTIERPLTLPDSETPLGAGGWKVTVFNNDVNTYDEVIAILMRATACDPNEAYVEAWEIDHFGRCDVHFAAENACREAAKVIASIGIEVEVSEEA